MRTKTIPNESLKIFLGPERRDFRKEANAAAMTKIVGKSRRPKPSCSPPRFFLAATCLEVSIRSDSSPRAKIAIAQNFRLG
jgi:hypothetical protein